MLLTMVLLLSCLSPAENVSQPKVETSVKHYSSVSEARFHQHRRDRVRDYVAGLNNTVPQYRHSRQQKIVKRLQLKIKKKCNGSNYNERDDYCTYLVQKLTQALVSTYKLPEFEFASAKEHTALRDLTTGKYLCLIYEPSLAVVLYSVEHQICCDGLHNRTSEVQQCCKDKIINTTETLCCDDKAYNRSENADMSCCGRNTYNINQQICCADNLYNRTGNARCCGNQAYDTNTHMCCDGTLHKSRYQAQCCGNTWFYTNFCNCTSDMEIICNRLYMYAPNGNHTPTTTSRTVIMSTSRDIDRKPYPPGAEDSTHDISARVVILISFGAFGSSVLVAFLVGLVNKKKKNQAQSKSTWNMVYTSSTSDHPDHGPLPNIDIPSPNTNHRGLPISDIPSPNTNHRGLPISDIPSPNTNHRGLPDTDTRYIWMYTCIPYSNIDNGVDVSNIDVDQHTLDITNDLKFEFNSLNVIANYFSDANTQTEEKSRFINKRTIFQEAFDQEYLVTADQPTVIMPNSDVKMMMSAEDLMNGPVEVQASSFNCISDLRKKLGISKDSDIASPTVEYAVTGKTTFVGHACVIMPFVGRDPTVWKFKSDSGLQTVPEIIQVPLRPKQNMNLDLFYEIEGNFVKIYTKSFSGFYCTIPRHNRGQVKLRTTIFASYKRIQQLEVRVKAYIVDEIYKFKDYKVNLIEQEDVEGKVFKKTGILKPPRTTANFPLTAEDYINTKLTLFPDSLDDWTSKCHPLTGCPIFQPEMNIQLDEILQHCDECNEFHFDAESSYSREWYLVSKPDRRPSHTFQCIVSMNMCRVHGDTSNNEIIIDELQLRPEDRYPVQIEGDEGLERCIRGIRECIAGLPDDKRSVILHEIALKHNVDEISTESAFAQLQVKLTHHGILDAIVAVLYDKKMFAVIDRLHQLRYLPERFMTARGPRQENAELEVEHTTLVAAGDQADIRGNGSVPEIERLYHVMGDIVPRQNDTPHTGNGRGDGDTGNMPAPSASSLSSVQLPIIQHRDSLDNTLGVIPISVPAIPNAELVHGEISHIDSNIDQTVYTAGDSHQQAADVSGAVQARGELTSGHPTTNPMALLAERSTLIGAAVGGVESNSNIGAERASKVWEDLPIQENASFEGTRCKEVHLDKEDGEDTLILDSHGGNESDVNDADESGSDDVNNNSARLV